MQIASSQEDRGSEELQKAQAAETSRLAAEEAAKWQLSLNTGDQPRLVLQQTPVLRWSHPVSGSIYG